MVTVMFFCKRGLAAVFLAGAMPFGPTAAEKSPQQQPISIVVGFPPGGPTDALARIVAKAMAEHSGRKVIVENRPGAAGNVAAAAVARSGADGRTLYLATRANVLNAVLNEKVDYDVQQDFVPVAILASVPNVVVVGKYAAAQNMEQLIAQAKDHPKRLACASAGVGSTSHVLCELFQAETDTEMLHVPYRGAGPALMDLITGQVDVKFDSLPSSLPHIRRGDLRALGVLSAERSSIAADIPTLEELGLSGLVVESWYGLLAPAGTSLDLVMELNESLNKELGRPDVRQAYAQKGYAVPPVLNTPQVFQDLLDAESRKWHEIMKTRNIMPG
jgi:tripartite-type tricarboxylate transporter receptor subunit TctC